MSGAMVGLFGTAPEIELRSVLDVTDRINLKNFRSSSMRPLAISGHGRFSTRSDSSNSPFSRKAAGATTRVDPRLSQS